MRQPTPTSRITWTLVIAYLVSGSGISYLVLRSDDAGLKLWLPIVFCATFYCCARRLLIRREKQNY